MKDCKFCSIVSHKSLRKDWIIYKDRHVIVFPGRQHHKGHIIIALKRHEEYLLRLSVSEADKFFNSVLRMARAVKRALKPDRLNYALFGNWVPHLHWHIYPRLKEDLDWGQPPYLLSKKELSDFEETRVVRKIKAALTP